VRVAAISTLLDLAERDRRIVLLTGDLGFSVIEPFAERFPERFFNVGVAEQNMMGLASGLAEGGYLPFVYSIATFASLRPYEFIRNGPVLHDLPVRILGIGGGFEYGDAGPTHHALEDVGILRVLPGLRVICPADHQQAAAALRATWNLQGPTYYRLGKDDTTTVPDLNGRFELGRSDLIRDSGDLLLVAMGNTAAEVARAADALSGLGIEAAVLIVSTLAPPPEDDLAERLTLFPLALTVEAHQVIGGLGSLVSEIVAERGLRCRVVRCGAHSLGREPGGGEAYLLERSGLTAEQIAGTAQKMLSDL
jgi:transketolase